MTEGLNSTSDSPAYFFIIGAMKAGTTSLYKYLKGHPEVYASPRKEPHVFCSNASPDRMRAEFLDLFQGRTSERWCFEASTGYTKHPFYSGVPARLAAAAPNAHLVYLVRNPVDRIWSQYVHNLAHGRERREFQEAITREPQYLDISRYHLQLTQYLDVFPRERILIQVFEEMITDPLRTIRSVCEFLAIDASYQPAASDVAYNASSDKLAAPLPLAVIRNAGMEEWVPWRVRRWLKLKGAPLPDKKSGLTAERREWLCERLRPDVEAFFTLLGRRVPAWTEFALNVPGNPGVRTSTRLDAIR